MRRDTKIRKAKQVLIHSAESNRVGLLKVRQAQLLVVRLLLSHFGRAEKSLIDSCQLSGLVLIGEMRMWAVLCLCF